MSLAANRSVGDAEAAFLERMRSHYEEQGYRYVVHPLRSELPEFLDSYIPDAIAMKDGDNVAIEVISRATPSAHSSIAGIRNLFEDRPDWRLTIVNMGREPSDTQEMPVPGKEAILERVKQVQKLAETGDVAAAFVVAWSLLEAAFNSLHPNADKRPRLPGTVVQALSMNGDISYESEHALRPLIELRNRIVHGDLDALPTDDDVGEVLSAVRAALEQPAAETVG
ncbi:hypothetical protein [Aquibium oceanicum]|uniref:REase AHJR-like domain-containing protein n=1 Tax=Aquibium oceanicum TaxID=1670800 RepID=A0A1L3SX57_9HYPH|nr:hypothetical protein [Aquibium oceanicum]APH73902.1 hypothetical protein BSQ44_22895 [Aquibium oceanicum]